MVDENTLDNKLEWSQERDDLDELRWPFLFDSKAIETQAKNEQQSERLKNFQPEPSVKRFKSFKDVIANAQKEKSLAELKQKEEEERKKQLLENERQKKEQEEIQANQKRVAAEKAVSLGALDTSFFESIEKNLTKLVQLKWDAVRNEDYLKAHELKTKIEQLKLFIADTFWRKEAGTPPPQFANPPTPLLTSPTLSTKLNNNNNNNSVGFSDDELTKAEAQKQRRERARKLMESEQSTTTSSSLTTTTTTSITSASPISIETQSNSSLENNNNVVVDTTITTTTNLNENTNGESNEKANKDVEMKEISTENQQQTENIVQVKMEIDENPTATNNTTTTTTTNSNTSPTENSTNSTTTTSNEIKKEEIKKEYDPTEPNEWEPPFPVPEEIRPFMPTSQREHDVLERTLDFVIANGDRSEVMLRMKQAQNPNFAFLMPSSERNRYYMFLKKYKKEQQSSKQTSHNNTNTTTQNIPIASSTPQPINEEKN